ncbi:MAG TPA: hypothetical protein VGE01_10685 [Fimbriimonas sp.]
MMEPVMMTGILCIGLMSILGQTVDLNEESAAKWRDYLRPKQSELAFEESEWRPTFWEAVVEAQKGGKPILLWAMNGHPLACT